MLHAYLTDYLAKVDAILDTELDEKNQQNILFIRGHVESILGKNEKHLTIEEKFEASKRIQNKINRKILSENTRLKDSRNYLPLIATPFSIDAEVVWGEGINSDDRITTRHEGDLELNNILKQGYQEVSLPDEGVRLDIPKEELKTFFIANKYSKEQAIECIRRIKSCRNFNMKLRNEVQGAYDLIEDAQNQRKEEKAREERKENSPVKSFFRRLFSR